MTTATLNRTPNYVSTCDVLPRRIRSAASTVEGAILAGRRGRAFTYAGFYDGYTETSAALEACVAAFGEPTDAENDAYWIRVCTAEDQAYTGQWTRTVHDTRQTIGDTAPWRGAR